MFEDGEQTTDVLYTNGKRAYAIHRFTIPAALFPPFRELLEARVWTYSIQANWEGGRRHYWIPVTDWTSNPTRTHRRLNQLAESEWIRMTFLNNAPTPTKPRVLARDVDLRVYMVHWLQGKGEGCSFKPLPVLEISSEGKYNPRTPTLGMEWQWTSEGWRWKPRYHPSAPQMDPLDRLQRIGWALLSQTTGWLESICVALHQLEGSTPFRIPEHVPYQQALWPIPLWMVDLERSMDLDSTGTMNQKLRGKLNSAMALNVSSFLTLHTLWLTAEKPRRRDIYLYSKAAAWESILRFLPGELSFLHQVSDCLGVPRTTETTLLNAYQLMWEAGGYCDEVRYHNWGAAPDPAHLRPTEWLEVSAKCWEQLHWTQGSRGLRVPNYYRRRLIAPMQVSVDTSSSAAALKGFTSGQLPTGGPFGQEEPGRLRSHPLDMGFERLKRLVSPWWKDSDEQMQQRAGLKEIVDRGPEYYNRSQVSVERCVEYEALSTNTEWGPSETLTPTWAREVLSGVTEDGRGD